MPTVSVIIPSYNHEKFIAEAIQSILNQTYQDFEIVITDDCSSDNSVKIIKQFTDPRIRLFCNTENQGCSTTTTNCIKQAKGKYIAVLNSDDVFLPDKLSRQVAYLETHNHCAAVFSHAQVIHENGDPFTDSDNYYVQVFSQKNKTRHEWLNLFFYHGNCLCHPSILIRKECFDRIGLYDSRLAQLDDFDMWVRVCLNYEIHILQEPLIKFRVLNNNKNASAPRPDTLSRLPWEHRMVLNNFLQINSVSEFNLIFPEIKIKDTTDHRLIPYYLAQAALTVKQPMHNHFAIQTLFNLMAEFPQELKENFNFTYKSLTELTGNVSLMGEYRDRGRASRILFAAREMMKKCLS